MQQRLTPQTASKHIQSTYNVTITAASLSAWIRTGRCPFGEYIRRKGNSRGMYLIFQERMDAYFRPRSDIVQMPQDSVYF